MTTSLRELGLEGDRQVGTGQEHLMSVAFHNKDDFLPKLPVEEMGEEAENPANPIRKTKTTFTTNWGSGPSPEKQFLSP